MQGGQLLANRLRSIGLEGRQRRIRGVGAFPDRASALRLVTAVALKVAAIWSARRYVDVALLKTEADQAA